MPSCVVCYQSRDGSIRSSISHVNGRVHVEPTHIARSFVCNRCWGRFMQCQACNMLLAPGYAHGTEREISQGMFFCYNCYCNLSYWPMAQFDLRSSKLTFLRTHGIKRAFGVEIETSECPGYRAMKGKTLLGAKSDCSINGIEFVTPPIAGDQGLAIIEDFCETAEKCTFEANGTCGLHVHFDMQDETDMALRHIAYGYQRTYAAWVRLVNQNRRHSSYCRPLAIDRERYATRNTFADVVYHSDRYFHLNPAALHQHGTFENRLHHGTVDSEEICNWIVANLVFIDAVRWMSLDQIDAHTTVASEFCAKIFKRAGLDDFAKQLLPETDSVYI